MNNPLKKEKGPDFKTPDLSSPEKIPSPQEKKDLAEKSVSTEAKPKTETDTPSLPQAAQPAATQAPLKSKDLKQIESVLQEDLEDIYFNMDAAHRKLFKEEGERVAHQVEAIIHSGQAIAIKILELIKHWLKFIPGVNKFFLEQEAKIKTDKIIKITQPK